MKRTEFYLLLFFLVAFVDNLLGMENQKKPVMPSLKKMVTDVIITSLKKGDESIIDICRIRMPNELYAYLDHHYVAQTWNRLSILHYFVLLYPNPLSLPTVKKLLDYYPSMDINKGDCLQETALHKAATWGFSDVTKLLLERNADVQCVSIHGDTPLHLAALRGYCHEIKGTIENGFMHYDYAFFMEDPLPNSVSFTPNKAPKRGTKKEYVEIMTRLLAHGAQETCVGRYGNIPLHNAADWGFYKGLLLLLEKNKATVNEKNKCGQTALHKVMRAGNVKSVQLLLNFDAESLSLDDYQMTPLFYAQKNKNSDAGNFLIQYWEENSQKEDASDAKK